MYLSILVLIMQEVHFMIITLKQKLTHLIKPIWKETKCTPKWQIPIVESSISTESQQAFSLKTLKEAKQYFWNKLVWQYNLKWKGQIILQIAHPTTVLSVCLGLD